MCVYSAIELAAEKQNGPSSAKFCYKENDCKSSISRQSRGSKRALNYAGWEDIEKGCKEIIFWKIGRREEMKM